MDIDSDARDDAFSDRRLARALFLLQKPVKKPASMWGALAASTGLAIAATALAVIMVFEPGTGLGAGRQPTASIPQASASSAVQTQAPAFELSGSSLSASPLKTTPMSGSEDR